MKLEDFNQLDFKTLGSAPAGVKAVLLAVIFLLLVAGGYWFMWKPAMEELDQVRSQESQLRNTFLAKKREAVNLPEYKQQMADIERTFGALLRQLPDKTQMDGLLNDINQSGLEVGLSFEQFKPEAERPADFYAERPIALRVTGDYQQLGAFAQNVANLSRIVTLSDLSIVPTSGKDAKGGELTVNAVARTFRYLDASEVVASKPKRAGK